MYGCLCCVLFMRVCVRVFEYAGVVCLRVIV